jgi:hypothetical protein
MKTRTDFTDYKFRCSSLGTLMSGVKPNLTAKQEELMLNLQAKQRGGTITEKQSITLGQLLEKKHQRPELSKGVKTYLEQLHKEEVFDKREEIRSKYLDKGIQCEEESLSLYTEVTGVLVINNNGKKNRTDDEGSRRTNEFITGQPDNKQGKIREFKTSWSLATYPMHEDSITNVDYWWQCQGYMELFNLEKAELIYCLVDTPEELINDEMRRTGWKLGFTADIPDDLEKEIRRNMTFSDIPAELRVKVFPVERDRLAMRQLEEQLIRCRTYMNQLSERLGGYIQEAA